MPDSYYAATISDFLVASDEAILGELARSNHHALETLQRQAWIDEIQILKNQLKPCPASKLFLEFSIPRMGKRADAVIFRSGVVFVIEFKVGSSRFDRSAVEQVHDYALDLKNFHLGSHHLPIVPVLIATQAETNSIQLRWAADGVAEPILVGPDELASCLEVRFPDHLRQYETDASTWRNSGYRPTPTIIEAAEALYSNHTVEEISRSDAGAKNLESTSQRIAKIIEDSKLNRKKSICFITGVPGAGKTLAGLNVAALRAEKYEDEHAVFLSGNGPLVEVLREALSRDQVSREGMRKSDSVRAVRGFIQNIHHFRDHYVNNPEVPFEKVVIFDEAQRAWTSDQASKFMQSRRGFNDFNMSEPEFLISVMDRHIDWCTVICLIGGGQEINTGEAGILEWLEALHKRFPDWKVHSSDLLDDRHYTIEQKAIDLLSLPNIIRHDDLHLSVSMRSFRAEMLSAFVSQLLDGNATEARDTFAGLSSRYPIVLTREISEARDWLRMKARGSERYGLVASSGGHRLRPEGIHIKAKIDPASWFLNGKDDVRSSYFLEDVATQFDIQGLELDWSGVCWDADLRWEGTHWHYYAFKGTRWQQVRDDTRRLYLLNAYRVLLTRARQGMVIFVPKGNDLDHTRPKLFYDSTFHYLKSCGLQEISSSSQRDTIQ